MQVFTASTAEINSGFLNETESKHCIKVLRKSIGDEINITNGEGELLNCVITVAHQKKCEFDVLKNTKTSTIAPPLHLQLRLLKTSIVLNSF
jgi:16S rRNA (uracil1498-N3)-methyltransferase